MKFGLKRNEMLLAGFSIGGSLTRYVAFLNPTVSAAYARVAGGFWRPNPATCASPVNLLHTHGTSDRTVPLEGRQIAPGFMQANVPEAMQIWREANGCKSAVAANMGSFGTFTIEQWASCHPRSAPIFALHEGGHSIPKGLAPMVLDWFEALD